MKTIIYLACDTGMPASDIPPPNPEGRQPVAFNAGHLKKLNPIRRASNVEVFLQSYTRFFGNIGQVTRLCVMDLNNFKLKHFELELIIIHLYIFHQQFMCGGRKIP